MVPTSNSGKERGSEWQGIGYSRGTGMRHERKGKEGNRRTRERRMGRGNQGTSARGD